MTRETKIGLLVGLAFVIVIGILISDHLSSTNEPAGAPLRAAADNLRISLGQPGDSDVAPPLRVPTAISPTQPVPAIEELKQKNPHPPITFVDPPNRDLPAGNAQGNTALGTLNEIARQHHEEIVDAHNQTGNGQVSATPIQPVPGAPGATERSYEAQVGDTLNSIALKAYGSSSRANRQAIVNANPALVENRDLIVAGKSYTIPAIDAASRQPIVIPQPVKPTDTPASSTITYTVKARDTLWSIANTQVGSPTAVAAIEELNRDVLNGSDRVRPNMKLKLPARTAVSSSAQ